MNNVFLIGRLTSDPELKTYQDKSYTKVTLAVDRGISKADKEAGKQSADFINITLWNNTASNVCKYCHKGSLVAVNGKLATGSYTANDGTKKYTMDVKVNQFIFLDSKKKEDTKTTEIGTVNEQQTLYTKDIIIDDSELPF